MYLKTLGICLIGEVVNFKFDLFDLQFTVEMALAVPLPSALFTTINFSFRFILVSYFISILLICIFTIVTSH